MIIETYQQHLSQLKKLTSYVTMLYSSLSSLVCKYFDIKSKFSKFKQLV